MPMLIDKQEALKILLKYKGESLFRSIYGNICHTTSIEKREDCKIFSLDVTITPDDWDTVSTISETFNKLPVGKYIRESFPEKSKYEIDYIKWDANRPISQTGVSRDMWLRHIEAVYDIARRVKAKYPHLLFTIVFKSVIISDSVI